MCLVEFFSKGIGDSIAFLGCISRSQISDIIDFCNFDLTSPSIDVTDNWFILPLLCMTQFNHTYCLSSVVEAIQKLNFKLVPTID